MFTGLVEEVGVVNAIHQQSGDWVLEIGATGSFMEDVRLGDSIAVNGVCLTVTSMSGKGFRADVSRETSAHTSIAVWRAGVKVNLEKAMQLNARLGGHLVSGHVDGVGELISKQEDARSLRLAIRAPKELLRYIAAKGSITVDGVSLTVNDVAGSEMSLNIVPHTAHATTLGGLKAGSQVHLEVDLLARYTERLLFCASAEKGDAKTSTISKEFLAQHGFYKS
ncbi:riboflavin synthase [Hahella aquimaris]|uniref:riboflavin synthase n=1 Tax=Hahella sp. HNIBRBA332 TaxID=3015983 RepID=UPI00273B6B12|nr:riboflavin synthase [Hahella sp. HNIBRBA332]WLQ14033.1 riboflavin synthase [Hahella sp. HNIBRBA332]